MRFVKGLPNRRYGPDHGRVIVALEPATPLKAKQKNEINELSTLELIFHQVHCVVPSLSLIVHQGCVHFAKSR
jgi:hypothetical protein